MYAVQDGVEEDNVIEYNLAAWVHVIGAGVTVGGQPGQTLAQSPDLLQPADGAAAGFYITNACVRVLRACVWGC